MSNITRRSFNRTLLTAGAALSCPSLFWPFNQATQRSRRASSYTINPDRLRASLESLSRFGRSAEGGVSRVAWTDADIAARKFVTSEMMSGIGLDIRVDPAGNINSARPISNLTGYCTFSEESFRRLVRREGNNEKPRGPLWVALISLPARLAR